MKILEVYFFALFAFGFDFVIASDGQLKVADNDVEDRESLEKYHERTFIRYHHRRLGDDNQHADDELRTVQKRHLDVHQNHNSSVLVLDSTMSNVTTPPSVTNFTENPRKNSIRRLDYDSDASPNPGTPSRVCVRKYNKVAHSEKNKAEDATPKPYAINYDYDGVEYNDYDDPPRRIWGGTLEDGTPADFEECAHSSDSCYALWQPAENDTITILGQGCWEASPGAKVSDDCSERTCTHSIMPGALQSSHGSNTAQRALPAARFCCCTGDSCNAFPETTIAVATKSSQASSPILSNNGTAGTTRSAPVMAAATLAAVVVFAGLALVAFACRKRWTNSKDGQDDEDIEGADGYDSHGEGSISDPLATGLLCVDNLKIIEHIGAGRFGSVWRGTLGSKDVAVKIFPGNNGVNHWQREKDIYGLPHIKHPNILKYYGSDNRQNMSGGKECLLVVELASVGTLRRYLREGPPLDLAQFVNMALGLASGVAHLHNHIDSNGLYKPCVAHRDINTNNVLVKADLSISLADFGLAMVLPHRHRTDHTQHSQSSYKITEAGTLRYLAPEALEGALNLRSAGAALRAVDVYAMALVLWEILWRVVKVNREPNPPVHQLPYQHAGVPEPPTLEIMQSVVSRRKIRPPIPRISQSADALEARILQLAFDTCSECWDHDAEARLTAVCVRERLTDAQVQMAARRDASDGQPGSRGINRLKDCDDDGSLSPVTSAPLDYDKNSNCTMENARASCDQRTPLLYPLPHQGRNPCLERNLATVSDSDPSDELIDKSLKDIVTVPSGYGMTNLRTGPEDCLSVARCTTSNRAYDYNTNQDTASDRYSEARLTAQRPSTPIDYVQNDVSLSSEPYYNGRTPIKQTNLMQDTRLVQPKWGSGLRKLFQRRGVKKLKSPLDMEVKLVKTNGAISNVITDKTKTTIIHIMPDSNSDDFRPSNLTISENGSAKIWNRQGTCTISPPNQTISQTMMMESQVKPDWPSSYRELPNGTEGKRDEPAQVFAVIVPKVKYTEPKSSLEMQSKLPLDIYKLEDTKDSIDSIAKNSVKSSKSEHSLVTTSNSESDNSATQRKRASCDDKILQTANESGNSPLLPICDKIPTKYVNIEYDNGGWYHKQNGHRNDHSNMTAFGHNTDCSSSSEDEHLMLLSEDGGNKITMQCRSKTDLNEPNMRKKAKENINDSGITRIPSANFGNLYNKYVPKCGYSNLDNEISGDNPVYVATLNGTFASTPHNGELNELQVYKGATDVTKSPTKSEHKLSPRPSLKRLSLSRQHSLEQVGSLFTNSVDLSHLRNPADRVKTPGDVPPSVRRVRRDRVLTNDTQKARTDYTNNRLSLYDDRMMFGNSL